MKEGRSMSCPAWFPTTTRHQGGARGGREVEGPQPWKEREIDRERERERERGGEREGE